jgi:hypothetical protein
MTTKSNLSSRVSSINYEELPKTFQDTISLARALDVEYIWIDSLCIIQDDEDDWISESANMGEIYANSYLNISVVSQIDPTGGFLTSRERLQMTSLATCGSPPVIKPFPSMAFLELQNDSEIVAEVAAREILIHDIVGLDFTSSAFDNATAAPLFSRAWTFQERLLSPRIVHFTAQEMIWECQNGADCECGWSQHLGASPYNAAMKKLLRRMFTSAPADDRFTGTELRKAWRTLVELYVQKALSFQKDRLVALSAIARLVDCDELGQYLAGIWSSDLPQALAWRSVGTENRRATPYRLHLGHGHHSKAR